MIETRIDARYADGVLVFARQGKLYAVGFDPSTLSVTGTPIQVVDGVTHALQGGAAVTWSGAAQFSVSNDGSLFYAPGSIEPPVVSSLVWVDRTGKVTPVAGMRPMFRFCCPRLAGWKTDRFSELYSTKTSGSSILRRGIEDKATLKARMYFRSGRLTARAWRSVPIALLHCRFT